MSKCIVTSANSIYYFSLLTLISSIHKHSLNLVDKIIVFNLGLSIEEIKTLKRIKKVQVVEYPTNASELHSKFFQPKQFIFKPFCIKNAEKFGNLILWLDAGIMALRPIDEIFKFIEEDDIFLVGDIHLTKRYTHSECIKIMNATEDELSKTVLSAGILGYKANGKYQSFINEAYNYSLVEGCVDGDQEDHRHDQSVYSILAARYNIKKHDIDTYGYWTDFNRNINTAKEKNAVLFVHRNGHHDMKDIIYDN